jgi:antitoxin MazE
MSRRLKARIIKIGNSRGVRIPKVWLEQLDLRTEVEMVMQADQIIIRPARKAREGWEASFAALATHTDDELLDGPTPTRLDQEEWEWAVDD